MSISKATSWLAGSIFCVRIFLSRRWASRPSILKSKPRWQPRLPIGAIVRRGIDGGASYRKATAITNDTSYSFGDLTVRNIFGYRKNYSYQLINTGGLPILQISTGLSAPLPASVPFTLFTASSVIDRQYLTNETQLLGNFGAFNFIAGVFYNNDKPHGPTGSQFTAFSVGGVPLLRSRPMSVTETGLFMGRSGTT